MTHITYKTAKRLKEFLGESAPEPMCADAYKEYFGLGKYLYEVGVKQTDVVPAYQLHDLLSKPFCEAMLKVGIERQHISQTEYEEVKGDWAKVIGGIYFEGGLPAVEKALMEMMEAK